MIKKTLVRGLKVTIPLLLTILVIIWCVQTVESLLSGILKPILPFYFPGLSALIGLFLVFIMGVFVNAWIVRSFWQSMERGIDKIPLVKTIYSSIQDSMKLFDNSKGNFGKPVMIEFDGIKFLGFLTCENIENFPTKKKDEIAVYFPMSYQIGGYVVILPRSKVVELEWTRQETMKFVLSAGMTNSQS